MQNHDVTPLCITTHDNTVIDADKEFNDAIDRIYKKYGSNLLAFIRDVQRDIELKKQASDFVKSE